MMAQKTIAAVILAAGSSSRMGAVKQLMAFDGSTLLETVIGRVRAAGVDEIVAVLGAAADQIREKIPFDGIRVVMNEAYRQGMGTSLRCGIAEVSSDAALVVLGDQPLVKTETIARLMAEYRAKRPQIVIPLYRGFRGNPVLLDRSVFGEIAGLDGDVGCRAIFGGHSENILKVAVDDVGVLLDIDMPEDFSKLKDAAARTIEAADVSGREGPRIVIVGAEAVARVLAKLGRLMNFEVTMVDPFLTMEEASVLHELDLSRVRGADFVVIATAGRFDEEAVEQALAIQARYIALVANKRRAQEVLRRVQARGIDAQRVRTKAGIEIGAREPEEIALSIMAEIIAERHRTG